MCICLQINGINTSFKSNNRKSLYQTIYKGKKYLTKPFHASKKAEKDATCFLKIICMLIKPDILRIVQLSGLFLSHTLK